MVHDDGAGRLLGIDLPVLGQYAADTLGLEQAEELLLVGKVGARRIPEAVAAAPVVLSEEFLDPRRILVGNTEFLAHALVPQLGQRFGRLYAQTVEVQVLGVIVLFKELARSLAD